MKKIIIIGGGLSGLLAAILLNRNGCSVRLIEKHEYPRHKVCGEYVSMEVYPFLQRENLLPETELPIINKLIITSVGGKSFTLPLDMGGIGISRHLFENHLYQIAAKEGVDVILDEAIEILYSNEFKVETREGNILNADILIGAYGKRNKLDRMMERDFFYKRSPYLGVKFHADYQDHDPHAVTLHNFTGGYCGICNVEAGISNFCYLVHRDQLKQSGSIEKMQEKVLKKNPHLRIALEQSNSIFEKPLVINEISFETKNPVENNIIMIGDAAGMITPLCGNGMAIALHTGKLIADVVNKNKNSSLAQILETYENEWNKLFSSRLAWGRFIQRYFFGKNWASSMAVAIGQNMPALADYLVKRTHGRRV